MALSQQMPVNPIERVMPFLIANVVICAEAYWVPRSEWKMTCAGRSPRSVMAITRASSIRSVRMWSAMAQPITRRLCASMTVAR